ncbi:MAG: ribosome maturation factor RimP [Clostridia bacterium]
MSKITEEIMKLTESGIQELGFQVVSIEYVKEGKDWFLRFFINHEKGISLDDCEIVSRYIDEVLDTQYETLTAYSLEVSSVGVEKPINTNDDWENAVGKKINVNLYQAYNKQKMLTGELISIENGEIELKTYKEKIKLPINAISKANIAVNF